MAEPSRTPALPEWVGVAALAVLALALRLLYLWQVAGTPLTQPTDLDPAFYYEWAKEIAAGRWVGSAPFVQSPLYAYLLGLLLMIVGERVTPILVAQSLVGCGTVLLTWLVGRRLFDPRRALVAGLLVAAYGPFLFHEGMVMKTFLSPFLTLLLLLALDHAGQRSRAGGADGVGESPAAGPAPGPQAGASPARLYLVAGLVFGLLCLDRDNFIILAPALGALAVVMGGGWNRRGARAAAALAFGAALVIAPVTLRNWAVSHEFVLLTTGGGEVFFIGNNADATGLYTPPPFVRPDPRYEHQDFIDRASEIAGRPLSPMESSWFWFRQGLDFIVDQPLGWVALLGRKLMHFWNAYELPDNMDYRVLQHFSSVLAWLNPTLPPAGIGTLLVPAPGGPAPVRLHLLSTFGTVAPFGLMGIVLTRRRWRRLMPLYVLLFGYMATVLLFFNFSRFRVPIVPLLALCAAEGLLALGGFAIRLGRLAAAVARRSGAMFERAAALRPDRDQSIAAAVLAITLVGFNAEHARGLVPGIEQALVIGNAYYHQGEPERALESYCVALALLLEGDTEPACGDAARRSLPAGPARAAMRPELEAEAVAKGPQFVGIHLGVHHGLGIAMTQRAQGLLESGRRQAALPMLDRAVAQFEEALRLAPAYLLSHRKMARAFQLRGDTAAAIERLKTAIELWPEDLPARLELAEMLFASRDYQGALGHLQAAYAHNRAVEDRLKAQIFFNRGLILLRGMNDRERALFDFETALALYPGNPQAALIRDIADDLRRQGVQPRPDEAFAEPPAGDAAAAPAGRAPA